MLMAFRIENLIAVGIMLIIIGFFLVFFGAFKSEANSKTKVAIGGFIGPIPFGFGNDKNLVWFVTLLSVVIFLVWAFFNFRIGK